MLTMNSKSTKIHNLKINLFQILLLICSLTVIIPFLIMIFGSFKSEMEVTAFNLQLPSVWHFENYLTVIIKGKLVQSFLNGILITSFAVLINIMLTSMASFIIARKKSKFSEFLYFFFFIGMIAPMQIIPTIKLIRMMNLYGSYLSVILIYCTINMAFSVFLYVGFIKGIPKALDEAAVLEGASIIKVFFVVVFPLIKPVSMTILIIIFMNIWNDINIPIYFLNSPKMWTMPLSVYKFFGQFGGSNWNLVFAVLVLTAMPVVVVYLFAQKYIISGLTAGGVKQ